MKLKKALLVTGAASTIGLSSIAGMGVASAATTNSTTDPDSSVGMSGLVDKLATKFHLNKSDVQAVFDEDRSAHEADMQKQMEKRLDQAVTDGKITSAQKTLILNKQSEMKTFMDSLQDKTPDERDAAMKQKMTDLKTWASDNDIPKEYLHIGMHVHGGPGGSKDASDEGTSSSSDDSTN